MEVLFWTLIFLAAFFYSSVGHGGASGYLAIMGLYHFAPEQMRPTALCMNLFVSLISFYQYYKAGHFNFRLFWPLAVASIPMAFLGGNIHLDVQQYKLMLGVALAIIAGRFILFSSPSSNVKIKEANIGMLVFAGAIIGFVSGLIGIGGGVLLSPIILLAGWAGQKQTAATSALFIFVNSIAGLLGQLALHKGQVVFTTELWLLVLTGAAGSICGAFIGAKKLNISAIKYVLSFVLFIAAFHLLWK